MPSEDAAGFEHLDHTADLGIRAWGATLEEAFAQAAVGLFAQILELRTVEPTGEVEVTVDADALDDLLFRWLDELLYLFYTDLVVLADFDVTIEATDEGFHLRGRAMGEAYDADRHGHLHEVKAITYHALSVQEDPPMVEVIVDI